MILYQNTAIPNIPKSATKLPIKMLVFMQYFHAVCFSQNPPNLASVSLVQGSPNSYFSLVSFILKIVVREPLNCTLLSWLNSNQFKNESKLSRSTTQKISFDFSEPLNAEMRKHNCIYI